MEAFLSLFTTHDQFGRKKERGVAKESSGRGRPGNKASRDSYNGVRIEWCVQNLEYYRSCTKAWMVLMCTASVGIM